MTETTQIEAGRELDALVAVGVMGWRAPERARGQWRDHLGYERGYTTAGFSTTGDGMLAVLERMRALGWDWQITTLPGGSVVVSCWSHIDALRSATADTLPHAVCLAALEAVRA